MEGGHKAPPLTSGVVPARVGAASVVRGRVETRQKISDSSPWGSTRAGVRPPARVLMLEPHGALDSKPS